MFLDNNMTVFLKSNQKVCLLVNNNENLLKIRECKIFCVNEKIHTKKEVASVE